MNREVFIMNIETVTHEFPPLYDDNSKILILGTIPSPKSREKGFYYMHPQNRFWKMLSSVLNEPFPEAIDDRKALCLKYGIALWDVLASCEISGAQDSSIKNAVPNDIGGLIEGHNIEAVFTTGKKAHALYRKYLPALPEDICLPSTSPANRTLSESEMLKQYRRILDKLQ